MRTKIVAGNWKMNPNRETAVALVKSIADLYAASAKDIRSTIVICPPFLYLSECKDLLKSTPLLHLGAQNCHTETKGAYTGEISAEMLASVGAEYIIIGHSERRLYFGEDAQFLNGKVKACLSAGLTPIFCCGESLKEREAKNHFEVVESQIKEALFGMSPVDFPKIILAYEPVWAIGTGLTATPEQAQEMHHFIRNLIGQQYGTDLAEKVAILYGGSCNAANANELFSQPDVDGGLIGGASLKAADFLAIINAATQNMK